MQQYVEAGKLNRKIKILNPNVVAKVQDQFGGLLTGQQAPVLVANDWASIEFFGTATLYSAQAASAQVSHKVTIRWRPGVQSTHQIYYLDDEQLPRLLQVRAVENPEESTKLLILACLERPDLLAEIETIPE